MNPKSLYGENRRRSNEISFIQPVISTRLPLKEDRSLAIASGYDRKSQAASVIAGAADRAG
jgi:hypothetical protein